MIISKPLHSHQRGLSLIELMIAMVIGLMLLTGTASMFLTNKRIYREQDEMGRIQENARFAMQILIDDIRMAGYAGCSDEIDGIQNNVNGMDDDDALMSMSNAVEGIDEADPGNAANSPWKPSALEQTSWTLPGGEIISMVAGSDAISIRYLDPSGIKLSDYMPNTSAVLKVTSTEGVAEEDIIALSDCDSADIMQLTSILWNAGSGQFLLQHAPGGAHSPGNKTPHVLLKKYGPDAEIMQFVARRYFIGIETNGGVLTNGPSLYRLENVDAAPLELIDGVENMEILYGEDTANNDTIADTYVNADAVTNWANVVSARLSLLFRTVDPLGTNNVDTKTYNMLGNPTDTADDFDPTDDRRRRRMVTNTTQIRNRSN